MIDRFGSFVLAVKLLTIIIISKTKSAEGMSGVGLSTCSGMVQWRKRWESSDSKDGGPYSIISQISVVLMTTTSRDTEGNR